MNSEEIKKLKMLDREIVWHPFTQMREYRAEEPIIIERAEGFYLIDIDGNRYLDGISSLWVNVHGHQKEAIDQAIIAQLGKVAHSTLLGIANVASILLAEALLKIAPKNLSKVFYSDSGSTAVEIAVKMAFQYWQQRGEPQRKKFVTLENAYHGDTIGSVSVGGIDLFHHIFKPLLFESIPIQKLNLDQARDIFAKNQGEIAACIVEPMIQGAAGMLVQPPGFLSAIRKLCDEFNVLLICDEVATGFGRTGKMFAIEHEGIQPDFLCLAKGITGGYLPLAATLTTQQVFEAFEGSYQDFKTFFHGHSYTGNPLACAAALANLEIFQKENTLEKLPEKIKLIQKNLSEIQKHPCVKETRQLGLMAGIELAKPDGKAFPLEQRIANQVCKAARKQGILLRPLGDVVVLMPPLAIDLETLEIIFEGLKKAMQEVLPSS